MVSTKARTSNYGIDDLSIYVPHLYLPIESLAVARDLEYEKLHKGLGLTAMSVTDAHEDAATMAANAVLDLIRKNDLQPQAIGRIYLGTESALDGAKPTATYILDMLTRYFSPQYGPDCFLNCDVVDLTFACIGAVDALHNSLDWVRNGDKRLAIVVASDVAKYELGSAGEYTQGAGAIALLVRKNPRLLAIGEHWGVATRPVHDFYKPLRKVSKEDLIREVLQLLGTNHVDVEALIRRFDETIEVNGTLDSNEAMFSIHRETPVFDGPYSNDCYQERIGEALRDFAARAGLDPDDPATDAWDRLVFHLPYAFQARRMFSEVFVQEMKARGEWADWIAELPVPEPQASEFANDQEFQKAYAKFLRIITKTVRYRDFVTEKIEPGERASSLMGNLYTGSIFLSLMSTLEADLHAHKNLAGTTIGCFAYGSGSKSKVFEATVQPEWQSVAARFHLLDKLSMRHAIDYDTYEQLHRGKRRESVAPQQGTFGLASVETGRGVREGARSYTWLTAYEKADASAHVI